MSIPRTTDAARRGLALLLVVLTIAALAVLVTPFMVSMRFQERGSRNAVAQARAHYAMTAAYNHALAQLLRAMREYGETAVAFDDLPVEFKWAGGERSAILDAEVQDEQGKINVNTAPALLMAALFADADVGLGLTFDAAFKLAADIDSRRAANGPFPTLDSLCTEDLLKENQLDALRKHITVHSAIERDGDFARININTASVPALRAAFTGIRMKVVRPTPDPANTGNGAMSLVELPWESLEPPPGIWEAKCTDVQTNADTGTKTFTFTIESCPADDPADRTERGTVTLVEHPRSPSGASFEDNGKFSLHNGTTDFAVGDKFTFSAEPISAEKARLLLQRFRAKVLSADTENGTITLDDASKFPASGWVRIRGDVIRYAGRAGNQLQGCTDILISPASGDTVALIVPDIAAFAARLDEAVADGDISESEKSALIANAKDPTDDALLDSTTGFCFEPSDRYTIEAVGIVNDAAGREAGRMRVRRVVSLERGPVATWALEQQSAFDREITSRALDGLITLPAASYLADVPPSTDTTDCGVCLEPISESGDGWAFDGPTLHGATNSSGETRSPATNATTLVPGEDLYKSGDKGLFVSGTKSFRAFASLLPLGVDDSLRRLLVWIKPGEGFGGKHVLFDSGLETSSNDDWNRIRLEYVSGKLIFRIGDEAKEPRSARIKARAPLSIGSWHRIEAVWSGMEIGQMALLLDGRLIGSYGPSGDDAEAPADPALSGEKWITRAGSHLEQQGETGPVRGTQAGTTTEPQTVYGYGACKFINQDASTRKSDFNKVQRGGATLPAALSMNPVTALKSNIAADATAIPVEDATALPKQGYVKIGDEVIRYTDWTLVLLVDITDDDGEVTDTWYDLAVPGGQDGRGQDFGDNLATKFLSDAAAHDKGDSVICISVKVSDNTNYPMPHFLNVPHEMKEYFGLTGLDPNTCLVQIEDEWISYTHRAGTEFLVNVNATAVDLDGGGRTSSMRGAGGTDGVPHDSGKKALPVHEVTARGRLGAGDRVTLLDDDLAAADHEEAVIKRTAAAGNHYLVSFGDFLPATLNLRIKKGTAERNARLVKFPAGRFRLQRLVSIGAPVSGGGQRADSAIGCVRLFEYGENITGRRLKAAVDGTSPGGFDCIVGTLDPLFDGGTEWDWTDNDFGVASWPLHGFVKIDDEAFFYKVRYPHNIETSGELGALSRSASATVYGDAGIPATGNIVWTRQGAEQDPIAAGFNPHGGYLVITSYKRTKADDAVRSLESCNQEILDWLIAQGYVTQEFVDEHGTRDPETGTWTFDDITIESGWVTSESREFVRYTRIDPAAPGADQYTFHCDDAGRHLYGTHKESGAPLDHKPADDGEGGTLYPTLAARTVALTVLQRGGAAGARALGTPRSPHPAGSRILPLPNVPATILCGPPIDEDGAPALPYAADKLSLEDTSHFPESGYLEITNAAGEREIIHYTHKEEVPIPGSNPPRMKYFLSGIKNFRGRFGTKPIDLTGLAEFDDVRDTSAAQITAYQDPRRLVKLFRPRFHDRMPLQITMNGANEESRSYVPHDNDVHLLYFEAKKTARGAKWLSIDWTETVPENTGVIVLARVGGSPSWRAGVPVMWDEVDDASGRVIYKFDAPKSQDTDNAINATGDTIAIRVFFKFNAGYDLGAWQVPALKSLTVKYEAGPNVIESEILDY